MKQEHDYSGALEAFERLLKFFDEHCDIYCIETLEQEYADDEQCFTDIATIRAALTAAKWRPIDSAPIDLGFKYLVTNKWGDIGTGTNEYVSDFYDIGNGEYVRTATIKDPTHWKPLDKPPQDGGDDA